MANVLKRSYLGRFPVVFGRAIISRGEPEACHAFLSETRFENTHVEATLDHPFPAPRSTIAVHAARAASTTSGWPSTVCMAAVRTMPRASAPQASTPAMAPSALDTRRTTASRASPTRPRSAPTKRATGSRLAPAPALPRRHPARTCPVPAQARAPLPPPPAASPPPPRREGRQAPAPRDVSPSAANAPSCSPQ